MPGITPVGVFIVLALLTIMSQWADIRVRHEQEAAAEAAVQQATAAAAAAAERFRSAEAAVVAGRRMLLAATAVGVAVAAYDAAHAADVLSL